MPFPIAASLAIPGIKAILRFRDRVDTILSIKEVSEGLPFALPPAPREDWKDEDKMIQFFETNENGQLAFQIRALQEVLEKFKSGQASQNERKQLFDIYYQASGNRPQILGPSATNQDKEKVKDGPSADMVIAYYVVESHRLSRNPIVTRFLLAAADTLLEFAGENASLFISNPKTRGLVETLIDEFARKGDFDDERAERIFKRLLGSTIVAVTESQGVFPDKPALRILFAALGDVRTKLGDDTVAKIVAAETDEGFSLFTSLVSSYLTHAAKDPSFLTKDALVKEVLSDTLKEIGQNLPQLIDDPKGLLGVLEVALTSASANVSGVLERKFGDKPMLSTVLSALVKEVNARGRQNGLFKDIASGEMLGALYKATLTAVAANATQIADRGEVQNFIADWVSGLATAIAQQEFSELFTTEALQELASKSLDVLASHPELLARDKVFATKVLEATLRASSQAVTDGLGTEDILPVTAAAIKAASENLALVKMGDQFRTVLISIGESLAQRDLQTLLTVMGRRDTFLAALNAVNANPDVWRRLGEKELVQPLVTAILKGLSTHPSHLLSGPILVDAIRRILLVVARRGQKFINSEIDVDTLNKFLTQVLTRAEQEIGKSLDGENLPDFLERITFVFLKTQSTLPDNMQFSGLVDDVLNYLETR